MTNPQYPTDRAIAFLIAMDHSDTVAMRRLLKEEPDLFRRIRAEGDPVFCEAAKNSSADIIPTLVSVDADINEQDSNGWTALCWAVARGRYEVAEALLQCGADPNLDCPLFRVTRDAVPDPIAMAKLLLDHGADVNQPFEVEGMPTRNVLSESVAIGNTELVEFLKSRGACLPGEGDARKGKTTSPVESDRDSYSDDILAHFRRLYGHPVKRVIREVVPTTKCPVAIHYIPPSANKQGLGVLFTEGLSQFEMPVPSGAEQYRRAELMVALDKTWPPPEKAIKDPKWAWPIQWLRKIAAYAVENNTWLGAELSTMAEEVPPKQPLGPGTAFTAWLLVSLEMDQTVVRCKDGMAIRIYQLFPLYTEEYLFARDQGAGALMSLLVKHEIQEHIDVNRPNVVSKQRD